MILPDYKIEIISQRKTQPLYKIFFDKVIVLLSGDAKYKRIEIRLTIRDGCKRRNVSLLKYLRAINDFLASNSYICEYDGVFIDLFDSNIVKFLEVERLKITKEEIEYVKYKFPNLVHFFTEKCTIYSNANMGY